MVLIATTCHIASTLLGGSNTSAILHRDEARETDRLTDVRKKTDDVSVVTDKLCYLTGGGGEGQQRGERSGGRTDGEGGSRRRRDRGGGVGGGRERGRGRGKGRCGRWGRGKGEQGREREGGKGGRGGGREKAGGAGEIKEGRGKLPIAYTLRLVYVPFL